MPESKLQSLTQIFSEKFFRIPDFQRGYSWGENQLDDFWEDILNLKSDKDHYTGLITVKQVEKNEAQTLDTWQEDLWLYERGFKAYHLIDGQQRLTTSIILIKEILNQFQDEDINFKDAQHWTEKFLFETYKSKHKSFIFGYEKDNPSDEYFKSKILEQDDSFTADKVPEQTLYTANLAFAKNYFKEKLQQLSKDEIELIFRKLTNSFKFNFYEIDSELDVSVTFETMNNRGKPLSNLELLKNRLIYLSTLLDDDHKLKTKLRKSINEAWKTIYEYLGKNKDRPLNDDDFLRNHWIMYFKYDRREKDSYAKYLLNTKFTAKRALSGQVTYSEIEQYILSLSKCVKSWFYLFNAELSTYSNETKEWLQKLNRLGMSAFPPLFMAALTKEEESEFLPLLKSAEKFIFLVFRLTQRPSNTKDSHFYRKANDYYFDRVTIKAVVENVEQLTDGYDANEYYIGWFDLEKFESSIKDLYNKKSGYYSWNGLRYFLYEYELYLQDKAKGNTKVTWSNFNSRRKEDSVEHIYPQTPTHWQEVYNDYSDEQKVKLLHSLGNLVLVSQGKNSELQNREFEYKKKHTNKNGNEVGFFNGSYSEIEVSSCENWHPEQIAERGVNMLNFMSDRWGFSFEEWNVVLRELLHVSFLTEEKITVE